MDKSLRYCSRCDQHKRISDFVPSPGFPVCQECKDHELTLNREDLFFCSRCKQVKPRNEFTPSKRGKNGIQTWCRSCHSEYHKLLTRRRHGKVPHSGDAIVCRECGAELGVWQPHGACTLENVTPPIKVTKANIKFICSGCNQETWILMPKKRHQKEVED